MKEMVYGPIQRDPERPWRLCVINPRHPDDFSVYIIDDDVRFEAICRDSVVHVEARYARCMRKAWQRRMNRGLTRLR